MLQTRKCVGFDFVLKISERCNLACPYCYYYFQDFDSSSYPRIMKRPVVDQLGKFLVQSIDEMRIDRINLGLHGGEPLLLKKKEFDHLCQTLKGELSGRVEYSFGLQTNGTLIDEDWIELFEKHGVKVGLSIDGPKEHHNLNRPDKRGRGTYDQTMRGLELLRKAGSEGRLTDVGALCVVDPNLNGAEVFKFFVEELRIPSFTFLLPRTGWGEGLEIQQESWVRFFNDALDYWLEGFDRRNLPYNRLFSDTMLGMLSDKGAEAMDWKYSQRHHVVTVSSDGTLGIDDNVMALDRSYSRPDMSIFDTTLREFTESPLWRMLCDAIDHIPDTCRSCEWYRTCRSGELFNRYSRSDGLLKRSVFCTTIDAINERIARHLVTRGLGLPALAERLNQTPTASATDVQSQYQRGEENEPKRSCGVQAEVQRNCLGAKVAADNSLLDHIG